MTNEKVLVVLFNSVKISCFVCKNGPNDTFIMLSEHQLQYSGFFKGKFNNEGDVKSKFTEVIGIVERECQFRFNKIYIGVPNEFCIVKTGTAIESYKKRKKIKDVDIDKFLKNISVDDNNDMIRIHKTIICYNVDGQIVKNPQNLICDRIMGKISSVYILKNFYDLIVQSLKYMHKKDFQFISVDYAKAMLLFDEEIRQKSLNLVSVDVTSSSVIAIKNDGLLGLCNFSMGGANITKALMDRFNIDANIAQKLKSNAILTLSSTSTYEYKVREKNIEYKFPSKVINDLILSQLEIISRLILKSLSQFPVESFNELPIYITGEDICEIKGIENVLEKFLNKSIKIIQPDLPNYDNPQFSNLVTTAKFALNIEENSKKRLF